MKTIRFGLDAVRDVGEDAAASIAANAPYTDLADFLDRVQISSTAVASLIEAGAFDGLYGAEYRASLLAVLPAVSAVVLAGRRLRALGQAAPFAGFHVHLSPSEQSLPDRLAAEHHALGCYVSGHPSDSYDLTPYSGEGLAAGLVTSIQRKISKRGEPYAVTTIEDPAASREILWFPQVCHLLDGYSVGDVIAAEVGQRDDQLIGARIKRLEPRGPKPQIIHADAAAFDLEAVRAQRASLNGSGPVHLVISCGDRTTTFALPQLEMLSHP